MSEYKNVFKDSDFVWLFFSPEELKKKGLKFFSKESICELINHQNIRVFNNSIDLINIIQLENWKATNLLLMSSGNFQGINFKKIIHSLK